MRSDKVRGTLRLEIDRPEVGLVYGLEWEPSVVTEGAARGGAPKPSLGIGRARHLNLADTLRHAREARGLSQRRLAAELGLSWVTVREAERGRDARQDTLARYLSVMDELAPQDLLPGPMACGPLGNGRRPGNRRLAHSTPPGTPRCPPGPGFSHGVWRRQWRGATRTNAVGRPLARRRPKTSI